MKCDTNVCKKGQFKVFVIIILLAMLILNILSFTKKESARNLETIKVGGVANMESVQELYKSDSYIAQQSAAIDQALAQINTELDLDNEPANLDTEDDTTEDDGNTEDIVIDEDNMDGDIVKVLEDIKASTIIHGDKNARFTIIEYSEFLCPYCKRQSDQGTINSVIEDYPTEVNAIFRNFIVHGAAAKLGEGVECMGELGKENKYFEFIEKMFAHQGNLNTEAMIEIADKLGVDDDDMKECLDSEKYNINVNQQTSEGRKHFGVTGTPGNVIIDKQTGKFVLIPGAYPAEKFVEEIEKMKAK